MSGGLSVIIEKEWRRPSEPAQLSEATKKDGRGCFGGGGPWAETAWSGARRGGGGGGRFRVVEFNWEESLGPVEVCLLVCAVLQALPHALDIKEG